MTLTAIIFWIAAFLVVYTYAGYGLLLWALVRLKEAFRPRRIPDFPADAPEVTLLIAAYNERDIVADKMANCRALDYPAGKLHIVWITDGSTDDTGALLAAYPEVRVLHDPARRGKTVALNRSRQYLTTPIVVYTDANTMLNPEAVREIVRRFEDPKVGCVAGEKRVAGAEGAGAAATEGVYWKYESKLKELDSRLHTVVGAAGELYAVRRELIRPMPDDTLLDDFIASLRIAARGYKIDYCREAYALETPSADMHEEAKRKVRIAAGGLQSVWRLRELLNPFRYGVLWFQYVSHRVLRWTLAPLALALLLPLNIALLWSAHPLFYGIILALQLAFYAAGFGGWLLARQGRKNRLLFIPYYFLFMNYNVFRGVAYLMRNRGCGAWVKAKRS